MRKTHMFKPLLTLFKGYPVTLSIAVLGVILGLFLVHGELGPGNFPIRIIRHILNTGFVLIFAAPLLLSTELFHKTFTDRRWKFITYAVAVLLTLMVAAHVFWLDNEERFAVWMMLSWSTLLLPPFLTPSRDQTDAWKWILNLGISGLLAGIVLGILFFTSNLIGFVTVELFSLEYPVRELMLGYTWILSTGLFAFPFFVHRLTRNRKHPLVPAPKEPGMLVPGVILTFVAIFGLILYIYGARILFTGTWPESSAGYSVLSFGVFLLIVDTALIPWRNARPRIAQFLRGAWVALAPLIILLFTALGLRIVQYGITPFRYYGILAGMFLTAILIYRLIDRHARIQSIISAAILIVFLTSFGPWSAFDVSKRSQVHRLEYLAEQVETLPKNDIKRHEAWEQFSHVKNTYGWETVRPIYKQHRSIVPEMYRENYDHYDSTR